MSVMNGPRDLQSSHRCIHPARLVTVVLFSSTLVASSMAQSGSSNVLIPAILVPVVFCVGLMLVISCFCCKFINMNRRRIARATMVENATRPTPQVFYPQATPSAGGPRPYPVQPNYPQPVPSQPAYTEPQRVPLLRHEGDAPPRYEEAVNFSKQ